MRKSKILRSLALALVGVLMCTGVALADNLVVTGDELVAANLDLGTICADEPADSTVSLAARRNGSSPGPQVWANGATVTFSLPSSSGAGLSAAMNDTPSQVVLPSNWSALPNNTKSASKTATVTLNTSVTGPFAGTVTLRASGAGSQSTSVTRDETINVAAVVEDCAPADTTAPVIDYVLNPATPDGTSGWYKGAVTLTWTVTEDESPDSLAKVGCVDQSITADQQETTYSCSATSDGGSAGPVDVKIKRDATAPDILDGGFSSGSSGSNGWYTSAVSNAFSASDGTSGLADCASTFLKSSGTAEGATVKINSGSCSDNASNTNPGIDSIEYKIDLTDPTVTCAATPTFTMNQAGAQVSATVSDDQSGPAATPVSAPADTSSLGLQSVSVTGYDNAGRWTTVTCSYDVHYDFVGFDRPVDNNGVYNVVKAGQAVPLKFRVQDAGGTGITGLTAPPVVVKVSDQSCALGSSTDLLEEVAAGQSGLQDLGDGYYNFTWKTPKDYAGSCKKLTLHLGDGNTLHTALFKFTR